MSQGLERLARGGDLKSERVSDAELATLVGLGRSLLGDARREALALESRFNLVYGASHALACAALRAQGYRSDNRFLVFQCLQHTAGFSARQWRILSLCHDRRNKAEYEGLLDIDERLVREAIEVTEVLLDRVASMQPVG